MMITLVQISNNHSQLNRQIQPLPNLPTKGKAWLIQDICISMVYFTVLLSHEIGLKFILHKSTH
jgi:hypothetical protein